MEKNITLVQTEVEGVVPDNEGSGYTTGVYQLVVNDVQVYIVVVDIKPFTAYRSVLAQYKLGPLKDYSALEKAILSDWPNAWGIGAVFQYRSVRRSLAPWITEILDKQNDVDYIVIM